MEGRATDMVSVSSLFACFLRTPTTRTVGVGLLAVVVGRVVAGGWGAADAVMVGVGLLAVGPVEWLAHRHLFHAPIESRRSRWLRTGRRHQHHHLDPPELRWLLLDGRGAVLLALASAALVATWSLPLAALFGSSLIGPYLTSLLLAWAALANYEWVHLLVHSGHRPRLGFLRSLERSHRLHHYRNEAYWFGVTTHTGDRLGGTLPGRDEDVVLSPSARTLQ